MSLLLDARKKSLQAQSAANKGGESGGPELSLEMQLDSTPSDPNSKAKDIVRNAGLNLFNAKSAALSLPRTDGINRNLLFALGTTIFLMAIGACYLWYIESSSNLQPRRARNLPTTVIHDKSAPISNNTEKNFSVEIATLEPLNSIHRSAPAIPAAPTARNKISSLQHKSSRVHIRPQQSEPLNPLLKNAYLAYRDGRLDEARKLYLDMLGQSPRNIDTLLGLAVIAQQSDEDISAAQYYGQVLAIEPRNAVANAGMSALKMDDNSESRLKILLSQQGNSASLHFALGNLYARQSRWDEAQQAYFSAYSLDTKNAGIAFNLAVSLDRLGQGKLAAQYYQRALQLDPSGSTGFDHVRIEQRILELTHN